MKVRNVSSLGDLVVPVAGVTVLAGDVVEVDDELAQSLLEQPDNWESAESAASSPSTDA
jgi:hypothetical protein